MKIINADDFGISPGVNHAVIMAHRHGVLNSTSLIVNATHTDDAIQWAKENPRLMVGIHLNLTGQQGQRPISDPAKIPLLVNSYGELKHGFLGLMLLSFFKRKQFQKQVEVEMRAQIEYALHRKIYPTHLDSHRHTHMIPAIFTVAKKLASAYQIERLRLVNESLIYSWRSNHSLGFILNGGIIKYAILKTFYYLNRTQTNTYFYGLLYTGHIHGKNVERILVPQKYTSVEIAVHPSDIAMDTDPILPSRDFLLSDPNRQKEFETIMDPSLPSRIQ